MQPFEESAPVSMLARSGHASIAYRQFVADGSSSHRPGVVFLHGFMSDMKGSKALFLQEWCEGHGVSYLRFDQTGHGQSQGRFEDATIGRWAEDSAAIIESLTSGPQVLVGSSMGGWLALLVALRLPQRIAGVVGVAAAPDFTRALWQSLSAAQRAHIERTGAMAQPTPYAEAPLIFTRQLFEEGERQCLLDGPIAIQGPVRLLHGQRDDSVPWQTALRIAERVESPDVEVTLFKHGDHRLAEPAPLARLATVVGELVGL